MEFIEEDASAFARISEGKKAQIRETRGLLEKRSRHLMEQSALLKHEIDTFKSELAAIGIQDYLTGFENVCKCFSMSPGVWSKLPVELLQCIFARLPLPDIIGLRVLSKTWDRYVTGVTPGFTKLCAEQNPNMFALVSEGQLDGDNAPMIIKLYDSKENRWHQFETDILETCETMFAGDGGLVCLVSRDRDKEKFPLTIVVFNPLTRQWRALPSLSSLRQIQPRMVQLVMDRDSKCYKVLVVGPKKQCEGDAVVRIFSSETGKWSKPNIFSDPIFGRHYVWRNGPGSGMMMGLELGESVYDCASRTLLELPDPTIDSLWDKAVLVKDHLFVLQKNYESYESYESCEYHLTEYQVQSYQPHWVRLKVHECDELNEVSGNQRDVETELYGCQDFLVVLEYQKYKEDFPHKRTLLFDLSTSEWQIIPEIPEWNPEADMFQLRWDAVP